MKHRYRLTCEVSLFSVFPKRSHLMTATEAQRRNKKLGNDNCAWQRVQPRHRRH